MSQRPRLAFLRMALVGLLEVLVPACDEGNFRVTFPADDAAEPADGTVAVDEADAAVVVVDTAANPAPDVASPKDAGAIDTVARLPSSFMQIATGFAHSCGLRADGSVVCWGEDFFAESEPPKVAFAQISVGEHYACGLRLDGSVVCWGDNSFGSTAAPTSGAFTQVSAGELQACALRVDGTATCWGTGSSQPPSDAFIQIAAGGEHSCGLRADGTVK